MGVGVKKEGGKQLALWKEWTVKHIAEIKFRDYVWI